MSWIRIYMAHLLVFSRSGIGLFNLMWFNMKSLSNFLSLTNDVCCQIMHQDVTVESMLDKGINNPSTGCNKNKWPWMALKVKKVKVMTCEPLPWRAWVIAGKLGQCHGCSCSDFLQYQRIRSVLQSETNIFWLRPAIICILFFLNINVWIF